MSDSFRGHNIEMRNGEYVFTDTQEPTVRAWKTRPCGHCGKQNTKDGHDGCLATLLGVMNACCGHGRVADAYIQFDNGNRLSGLEAMSVMGAVQ